MERIILEQKEKYSEQFVQSIRQHEQMFDARMLKFSPDKIHEILNHQIWRSVHDCSRNAVQTYAHTYFGSKKIMNKNTQEMIEMLKENKGIDWNLDIPLFIKYGIYCKKILIEKDIGENKAIRTDYVFKQFKINFSNENLNMLISKYLDYSESNNFNNMISIDLDNLELVSVI